METSATLNVLQAHPDPIRGTLLDLRQLILETAETLDEAGHVVETLKWGQASFVTERPKSGTTIRIDVDKMVPAGVALYVPCSTSLVSEWRGLFPDLEFGGDRSVHFAAGAPLPVRQLRHMIAMALTYHSRKKR